MDNKEVVLNSNVQRSDREMLTAERQAHWESEYEKLKEMVEYWKKQEPYELRLNVISNLLSIDFEQEEVNEMVDYLTEYYIGLKAK